MKLFFLLLSFMIGTIGYAQEWNVGVKGGMNLSTANIKNSDTEAGTVIGFHLGGYANTMIKPQVALQPEIMLSLQGWKNSDNFNVSYLQVPVLLKYFLVDQFNVHAGPQIGFLLGEESVLKGRIKSTDFGFSLGGEFSINEQLGAVVRYNWGLRNFREDLESISDVKFRSRVLQISARYKLNK